MKKFKNLGTNLTKQQQKSISGGVADSCTVNCANGAFSCSSDSGDCSSTRNSSGDIIKIKCGTKEYDCLRSE